MVKFPYLVDVLAIGSLTGNATVTGSVLLMDRGGGVVISSAPIELLCETIFFLTLALLILVKLIDKLIRRRENKDNAAGKKSNPSKIGSTD